LSKASNQTLTLLSMVNGALKVMGDQGLLTNETIATALYTMELCEKIIHDYPATGDEDKNAAWMHARMKEWSVAVGEDGRQWNATELITMSLNFIEDIILAVKRKDVVEQLIYLRAGLWGMAGLILAAEMDEHRWLDSATGLTNTIYRIIEFSI